VEHIVRRLRQQRQDGNDQPAARVILEAALEVRGTMVYATLIILLTLVPIALLSGVIGAFFHPLAVAYVLALLASTVVALIVTPAMSLLLLSQGRLARRESFLLQGLQRGYTVVLRQIIRTPYPALVAVCLILLLPFALLPSLGGAVIPTFKEPDIIVQ